MVNMVDVKGNHYWKLLAKVVERKDDSYRVIYHVTPSYEICVDGPNDFDIDLLPQSFKPPRQNKTLMNRLFLKKHLEGAEYT